MAWQSVAATAAVALMVAGGAAALGAEPSDALRRLADEIRAEATRPNFGPEGWPLPLVSHWNKREGTGCCPAYQWTLLEQGHHILPWFWHPTPDADLERRMPDYYDPYLKRAADLGLPIVMVSTQWESLLYREEKYLKLPAAETPLLVTAEKIVKKVSPVGPVEAWYDAGRAWTASPAMKRLQALYPEPPLVVFLSNNEAARAKPAERDLRQQADLPADGGFRPRYQALMGGMRDGLEQPAWKKNARFVGYAVAPAPSHLGRWDGWTDYHQRYLRHETMNGALGVWDGGSPSYYLHDWCAITDFRVWSPQVEAMNWVPFLERETWPADADWWQEFSTWDGDGGKTSKRQWYREQGQAFTPERYGAMVEFGLWLVRPRVVREFRGHATAAADAHPWLVPILRAVDRIHRDPVLREFWRRSRLVANTAHPHPYQEKIPEKYRDWPRWYLLDTDLDPPRPWTLETELPVFALARVLGEAPARRYLVYAHSPREDRAGVRLTVPGYGAVAADVPVAGAFYLVDEKTRAASRLAPKE